MNENAGVPAPKKKRRRYSQVRAKPQRQGAAAEYGAQDKPKLPPLDPLAQAQEACRLAQQGNEKLRRGMDALRRALQVLAVAEMDYSTKPPRPMAPSDYRGIATEALDAWSRETGQNWRVARHQVVDSRAGRADHDFAKNTGNDGADYDG